jgi:pyruvate ferredoxin oxidoreductase alpha subunit/oxalate oxidoreductase subunit alpha
VDEFLPPYNPPHPLDPTRPVNPGPQIFPDQGSAINVQRAVAFDDIEAVIEEVVQDYNKQFGRKYSPFVDEYMMDDAEIAFFLQGAHARTARFAVNHLRKKGVKVGVARLRFMRPFPTKAVQESLSKVKAVGTVETSTSYGGQSRGGNIIHEARSALYPMDKRPIITSFMAGLGGEIVTLNEFYAMAKVLSDAVKTGKANDSYWMNFEKEVLDVHA